MNRDVQNIRRLSAELRENLVKCAADAEEDPVHDTRTGTRRLQATIESILRDIAPGQENDEVREAADGAMRLLKKTRRAAGPVRDLDVHRKLLEKLIKRVVGEPEEPKQRAKAEEEKQALGIKHSSTVDTLERPPDGLRMAGIEPQADELDRWLKRRREEQARILQEQADGAADKLDKRIAALEQALHGHARRVPQEQKRSPAVIALDSFARLAMEMQHLDADNLHDFRKGAKKARYVAELAAPGDSQAEQVAKSLKKLQDEIGDWHDWLVLAEEAHTALGDEAEELIGLIEREREQHFVTAMKAATRLRGRLMGEWRALAPPPAKRPSPLRAPVNPRAHRATA